MEVYSGDFFKKVEDIENLVVAVNDDRQQSHCWYLELCQVVVITPNPKSATVHRQVILTTRSDKRLQNGGLLRRLL
jgi:hypothetical protein